MNNKSGISVQTDASHYRTLDLKTCNALFWFITLLFHSWLIQSRL